MTSSNNNSARHDQWLWTLAALGITFTAIAVRLAANFSTAYPPATDAGYYPMQTHAWLVHGRLMYDDLPLLFWLNAALTKALMWAGIPLDHALLEASRILDCVLQPWTASAVMGTGYAWSGGKRRALPGCIAAAVLAVLSPPIMRMLSDFQKNSLGLVWMAAAIWACRSAMVTPTSGRWAVLAGFMILAALTHIGAFAVTSLIIGGAFIIWCWQRRKHRRQTVSRPVSWPAFMLFSAIATLIVALMFYFEPHRTRGLLRVPKLFLTGPVQGTPLHILLITVLVIGIALRWVWRDYGELPSADVALVSAMAASLLAAICIKNSVYFERLWLMATVPGVFLIAFILARRSAAHLSPLPSVGTLVVSLVLAILSPASVRGPYMNENAAAELRDFRRQIVQPQSTLVIAPHGLEWWAGYFLDTAVGMSTLDARSSRYNRVLVVLHTIAFKPPDAGPGFSPRSLGPPAQRIYAGRYLNVYELPRVENVSAPAQ